MFSFLVPALNEEDNIVATIETILAAAERSSIAPVQIIVVNDGSTDRTAERVESVRDRYPQVELLAHSRNQGMAACFRTALPHVKYERWMFVPGDNDMALSFLLSVLKFRDAAELVMSFPINSENRSVARNTLSLLFRIAYLMAFGITVNYVNGPCIYRTDKIRSLKTRSQGFSIVSELNTKLLRSGIPFCEIPGYFQTGSRPRSTVSFRNLMKVCKAFVTLIFEIHVSERDQFRSRPQRVFVDLFGFESPST